MKIDTQTIYDSFQELIKEEIKSIPKNFYDFGKFMFTVSSATIGFVINLFKDPKNYNVNLFYISITFLIISLIFALFLTFPINLDEKNSGDLPKFIEKLSKKFKKVITIWFIMWLLSLIITIFNLFW